MPKNRSKRECKKRSYNTQLLFYFFLHLLFPQFLVDFNNIFLIWYSRVCCCTSILECGIWAPNGQGRESWQIRVADNPRLLAELDSLYGTASNRGKEASATPRPAAYRAPVVLFVACDESYDLSQVDCGLWGGNVMLAAHSMGLGTCCLGGIARFLNSPDGAPFLRRLDLPATHRLLYAIALGYPAESPAPKGRDTSKIVFLE